MLKKLKLTKLFMIIIALTILFSQNGNSANSLILTIFVNELYNITNPIIINGSLTLNGSPVTDGLVSMQVNDPEGNIFAMRVLATGLTPQEPWAVEIVNFYLCDANGNPKSEFKRGGALGYKLTVQNNQASPQKTMVFLTFTYSNENPFSVLIAINETLEPGLPRTSFRYIEEFIPSDAPIGPAYVYVTAVNNLPQYEGIALCPENSITFNITSSSGGLIINNKHQTAILSESTPGNFSATIKISDSGGMLGNYTIYATSWYDFFFAQETKVFEAILLSDVNRDGTVDMADISILIDKFMSTPTDPEWDPKCDINNDGTVDMADISIAIEDFLKWGHY